jgi:hypothetical protein
LAAALDQSLVHPGRTDAQDGTAAEHSQSMLSGPVPQRAPAIPGVKSAAELFAEQCRARADERRRIREGG